MAYAQCITDQPTIQVTAGYDRYPAGGYHGGLDTVHTNYQAYSPLSGTVVVAHHWQGGTTGNDSWGNYIVVRFSDNQYYLAAHFASQTHSVGEVIEQGSFIGTQGTTGNVTGIHTHWEYWNGGQSTSYRADPSIILGIPNQVGTFEVTWDAENPPSPPTPEPTDETKRKRLPIWAMMRYIR